MKTIFGVSSVIPINKKLKNGYTMYDWVKRQKCFPAFCMRTLCGDGKITEEEIQFLRDKDCKIGLVIRNLTEAMVSTNFAAKEAMFAIEEAKKLNVPQNKGIVLFAEIQSDWSVNHDWMLSFAQIVFSNGYIPGFIGNTDSSKNFNFDRQSSHYLQSTKGDNYFNAVFMATEPKLDKMPEKWAPYCPSGFEPEEMSLWCCGTTTFDFIQVEDVYATDDKVLEKMW